MQQTGPLNPAFQISAIHPFHQLLSHLEKGSFFGLILTLSPV
jgi:hypothetical protein